MFIRISVLVLDGIAIISNYVLNPIFFYSRILTSYLLICLDYVQWNIVINKQIIVDETWYLLAFHSCGDDIQISRN